MPEQVLMSPAGTNSLKSQLARRQSSAFAFCPAPACFARPQANRLILRRQALPSFSRYGYAAYPTYRSGGSWGWLPGLIGSAALAALLQQTDRRHTQPQHSKQQPQSPHQTDNAVQATDISEAIDTVETGEAFWYFVDVPGLDKQDVQVMVNQQDRAITVSGERSQPTVGEDDAKQTSSPHRQFGKFSYKLALPQAADAQLVSAKVDRGVLRIKVLKSSEPELEVQTVHIE